MPLVVTTWAMRVEPWAHYTDTVVNAASYRGSQLNAAHVLAVVRIVASRVIAVVLGAAGFIVGGKGPRLDAHDVIRPHIARPDARRRIARRSARRDGQKPLDERVIAGDFGGLFEQRA